MTRAGEQKTYGRIMLSGDRWVITDLEPHVAIRFKRVFPRVPVTAGKQLFLTNTDDTCTDLEWFMRRYPLVVSAKDVKVLAEGRASYEATQQEAGRILLPDWQPDHPIRFRDGMAPYPYQRQAAGLAQQMKRLLLLDDVGLGKTVSALATIVDPAYLPAAIVVQAHLAHQWKEEYVDTFTELETHIVKGRTPYTLPKADLYIFKYSNISGWTDIAAKGKFKSVIFDEIQELRHGFSTKKGAAARVFTENAQLRMGLTATPIYNYGAEIHNVIDFIAPGALGSWPEFLIEWCIAKNTHWVVKDPQALGTYLREQHIVLRRTEEDVEGQMPPVNNIVHLVPYDEVIAAATEEEARMLAIQVMEGSFVERGSAARELSILARLTTGKAKAKGVAAYVRILLESGLPVLLMGWHREVYDIWLAELADHNPIMFTGSESAAAKKRGKHAFINGDSNLMFLSLRSGIGLDGLQKRCHTAVFGELDWSPQVHKQVIGRLRRPGQTKQVDAIYLAANGGSDPLVMSALGIKAWQSRGIMDPLAETERVHSDTTRIKMLAELYLKNRSAAA